MLRLLTLGMWLVATAASADGSDLEDAEAQADTVRAATRSALENVGTVDTSGTMPGFDEAVRRSATLPADLFPRLSDELTDPETLAAIGELMDNAETLAVDLGVSVAADEGLSVYVFASFSMPDASLKALIRQGELAGVPIVLRGLVNNSVEDTLHRVHTLYKESAAQESGAVIDPTLFARFGIEQVPSVVIAEYAAGACTPEACPTPDHVKLAGDVPLRYALERIALARPAYQSELRALMKALEPERQW